MGTFWKDIITSSDAKSSKRLVTLVIALHFIISSFSVLWFSFYVIYYLPNGTVEPQLLSLLKDVMEYDFYIILSGLGFITAENMGSIILERTKARVAGEIAIDNYDHDGYDDYDDHDTHGNGPTYDANNNENKPENLNL